MSDAVSEMTKLAKQEMCACKKAWSLGEVEGDWAALPSKPTGRTTIRDRIIPFIGSGMKQREVAQILGCTRGPIVKALKQLGAKL